jgi:hypothetical protein
VPGRPGLEKVFAVAQAQDSAARTSPLRALFRRHPPWYLELALVAVLLWGMDAVTGFRGGARVAGLAHGADVRAISRDLGGHVTLIMNGWLAGHAWLAAAAAGYYIVLHGLVAGVVGIALLRSRPPRFSLHRNALILSTSIGVAVFWLYPVAPPRMLPGFHDIASDTVPFFAQLLDSKAAGMFAALPSLHVIWAIWVAVALQAILRRRPWRALAWAYPALTIADVMATGNHYLLDVLAGPVVVLLAYAIAAGGQAAVRAGRRPAATRGRRATPAWAAGIVRAGGPVAPARAAGPAPPTVPNARIPAPIGRLARHAETAGTGPTADSCQDRQPTPRTASRQATRSPHELVRSGHHNAGDFIRYLRFWVPGFATA